MPREKFKQKFSHFVFNSHKNQYEFIKITLTFIPPLQS